ncbi:MAG: hypothetical protein KAJ01_03120 [Candidatus Hydrogenedentes bacterium]|nr:hypothetical protein [Candidatus Hydrogenedentota bacterium]
MMLPRHRNICALAGETANSDSPPPPSAHFDSVYTGKLEFSDTPEGGMVDESRADLPFRVISLILIYLYYQELHGRKVYVWPIKN